MRMTPLDIQHKVFSKRFRGYDPEQVNAFLDALTETLGGHVRENATLVEKLTGREQEMSELRKAESTLTNTLISTQSFVDQRKADAQHEADRIIGEAELKAEQLLVDARAELAGLHQSLEDLRRHRQTALEQIRSTAKAVEQLVAGETLQEDLSVENMVEPPHQEEIACSPGG